MKIVCYLPNASECINGIQFEKVDGVMVSVKNVEELDEEQVIRLSSINGYALQANQDEVEEQPEEETDMVGPETAEPEETAPVAVAKKTGRRRSNNQ